MHWGAFQFNGLNKLKKVINKFVNSQFLTALGQCYWDEQNWTTDLLMQSASIRIAKTRQSYAVVLLWPLPMTS